MINTEREKQKDRQEDRQTERDRQDRSQETVVMYEYKDVIRIWLKVFKNHSLYTHTMTCRQTGELTCCLHDLIWFTLEA